LLEINRQAWSSRFLYVKMVEDGTWEVWDIHHKTGMWQWVASGPTEFEALIESLKKTKNEKD